MRDGPRSRHIDFDGINAAALAALPALLSRWFPAGRRNGQEFVMGSLAGEPGRSCSTNLRTGKGGDFAAGIQWGDPIGLAAHAFHGGDRVAAARALAAELGMTDDAPPARRHHARPGLPPAAPRDDAAETRERRRRAADIWRASVPITDTPAAAYLIGRGCAMPPAGADVIRYHPACPYQGGPVPAMVALMTTADGNRPTAIHRTPLRLDGTRDRDRPKKMLGPSGGAVIRLSPDDDVTMGLGLSEGIETGLSVLAAGWAPVWAAGSAGTIRTFPVLGGVEALTVFADHDQSGAGLDAARACAQRWADADREATVRAPRTVGHDWNDETPRAA
ncbi:toprim domain-containing protein [uncultured Rhodospira sp.]|uniref:DUF7146 domain-containing protein n=1 Tax=uncultured Rhodospira sp. TaxID=1936189 RepID=UPI00261600B8|nr:toprim domain-containing protein [uncultured Rhodospira sp.]